MDVVTIYYTENDTTYEVKRGTNEDFDYRIQLSYAI